MTDEKKKDGSGEDSSLVDKIRDKIPGLGGPKAIRARRAMTVDAPADELYAMWRDLSSHPRWMSYLDSVDETSETRSRWVARLPGTEERVTWEAELIGEQPGERLAWKTVGDAPFEHSGQVRFKAAPGGRGTEVHVTMEYEPPGGTLGAAVASLFENVTAEMLQEQIRHFKQLVEAGEIATIDGQPTGNTEEGDDS